MTSSTLLRTRRSVPSTRPSLLARLSGLAALARSRRALARLDADQLADVGLTRAQAQREARRPLWDAPEAWLKRD